MNTKYPYLWGIPKPRTSSYKVTIYKSTTVIHKDNTLFAVYDNET